MEKVYAFTNENLTSYKDLFDFKNADILSVLGSGDQYFSWLLFGARNIDLYDINEAAWDYFLFKRMALIYFSYGQFYDTFKTYECFNDEEYQAAQKDLSSFARGMLDSLKNRCYDLSKSLQYNGIAHEVYGEGINIPYLEYDSYYKLQELLRKTPLPKFYHKDLMRMPEKLTTKRYDLVITSNIMQWIAGRLEIPIVDYKRLLESFNCDTFQALYAWNLKDDVKMNFIDNGYEVYDVASAKEKSFYKDSIVTLKRKK